MEIPLGFSVPLEKTSYILSHSYSYSLSHRRSHNWSNGRAGDSLSLQESTERCRFLKTLNVNSLRTGNIFSSDLFFEILSIKIMRVSNSNFFHSDKQPCRQI